MQGKPSAEVRRRARDLLGRLENEPAGREHARLLRAVEVLERLGTAEARRLLGRLVQEATAADAARDAKAALGRLGKAARGGP